MVAWAYLNLRLRTFTAFAPQSRHPSCPQQTHRLCWASDSFMCTCNRDLLSQCEESEAADGIRQKQDCHLHLLLSRGHEFGALRLRWHARSLGDRHV